MTRSTKLLALAATLVAVLAPSASAAPAGHWKLDDGAGATAADSSGNGNPGAVAGGATWIAGKRGGALRFPGSGSRMTVPRASVLEPAAGVTVQAWVRRAGSPGTFRYVVAKGATGCIASAYALYTGRGGGLQFYASGQLGFDYNVTPPASPDVLWDGAWHLATGTYDGDAVRLFIDGVEVGATSRVGAIDYGLSTTDDLFVGHYDGCEGLDYSGDIDDVKIFGRALTTAEVADEFRGPTFDWKGFFSPVDNEPTVNSVKAGSAVPVKFSLTGYQGMDVLAAGSPSSRGVGCASSAPLDAIELTSTAGNSSLSYDATSDRYNYVWKTDKAWTGTCRQLRVELTDGSVHTATFKFAK